VPDKSEEKQETSIRYVKELYSKSEKNCKLSKGYFLDTWILDNKHLHTWDNISWQYLIEGHQIAQLAHMDVLHSTHGDTSRSRNSCTSQAAYIKCVYQGVSSRPNIWHNNWTAVLRLGVYFTKIWVYQIVFCSTSTKVVIVLKIPVVFLTHTQRQIQ
jgi:hypothetical protein